MSNARHRAKSKGLPCDITVDDIDLPTHCPILGTALMAYQGCGKGPRDDSPSLDKVDPAQGYVRGNVMVVSSKANRLKNQLSPEQLAVFAQLCAEAVIKHRRKEHHAEVHRAQGL